jgi:hypothetical protein
MIYFLTTCFLDITYGVIHWTAQKLFSYFFIQANNKIEYNDLFLKQEHFIKQQTYLVDNYKQIIEKQQKQIDKLLHQSDF